jgi:hypothetical protein
MPEASIDLNGDLAATQYDVWRSGKIQRMKRKPISQLSQDAAN